LAEGTESKNGKDGKGAVFEVHGGLLGR
jgi:hypothetical protein